MMHTIVKIWQLYCLDDVEMHSGEDLECNNI